MELSREVNKLTIPFPTGVPVRGENLIGRKKEIGRIMHLGNLPEDDLKVYIKKKFGKLGCKIEQEAVEEIINKTNGHPYYSQLLCQVVYFSIKGEEGTITSSDVYKGFKQAIMSEKSYFDQIWFDLTRAKHLLPVLRSIAREEESPYKKKELFNQNLYRSLFSLTTKGFIEKVSAGHYRIRDPFLKEYIKMKEEEKG